KRIFEIECFLTEVVPIACRRAGLFCAQAGQAGARRICFSTAQLLLPAENFAEISFAALAFLNDSLFMGMRREARERAVQFLFQYDLNKAENLEEALKQFWDSQR